jgi:3-methyladenine DNA glycosylase AlkD
VTVPKVLKRLKSLGNPEKAKVLSGFFKTGKGQYGEGDRFLGVTVPEQRSIAKEYRDLPFPEIEALLGSPYHEARLTGLLVLTYAFEKADEAMRKGIFSFYLANLPSINNWDLVDVTAPNIIGGYLLGKKSKRKILHQLARSENLWERRIAIVSTFAFIRNKDFADTLVIAEVLLADPHDLIHKATGWMLREVGKRNESVLKRFLDAHVPVMPRTMLRYAIERFDPEERARYLQK